MSPQLDVSAALTNPYTLDVFNVLRRPETINVFGESSVAEQQTFENVYGIVTPDGDASLARSAEMQTQVKVLSVISRFALRGNREASGTNFQPDLVVWDGNSYIVRNVEDYSRYAAGFVKASCELIDSVASAETTV